MFKIDKNVPPPSSSNRAKYPFREMSVGDSFLISSDKAPVVRNAALAYGRRCGGKFLTRRISETESRVWRVA